MRTVEELSKIAQAGGGLMLDAAQFAPDDLARIARAGAGGINKPQLHITNTQHLTTRDLQLIAQAGQGCVIFDDA